MDNIEKLNRLLTELKELVDMIKNHTGPIDPNISTEEIKEYVEGMRRVIADIDEGHTKAAEKVGIDINRLTSEALESPDKLPEQQDLLKKSLEIQIEAKAIQEICAEIPKTKEKKRKKESSKTSQMRERRKLFKTIGGDNKWIPM